MMRMMKRLQELAELIPNARLSGGDVEITSIERDSRRVSRALMWTHTASYQMRRGRELAPF